jgi:hypothetical protein
MRNVRRMGEKCLNLYEVIRWGNDSTDEFTGGPNGPDTCFLVRASSVEDAAKLVDPILVELPHVRVQHWAHAIYWIGTDVGIETHASVLRGPYVEHAFDRGWRIWHRNKSDEPWVEMSGRVRDVFKGKRHA